MEILKSLKNVCNYFFKGAIDARNGIAKLPPEKWLKGILTLRYTFPRDSCTFLQEGFLCLQDGGYHYGIQIGNFWSLKAQNPISSGVTSDWPGGGGGSFIWDTHQGGRDEGASLSEMAVLRDVTAHWTKAQKKSIVSTKSNLKKKKRYYQLL